VAIRYFQQHRSPSGQGHHYLVATEEAVLKGQAALRAIAELLEEGFRPRLVISHGGTGLGLFVKDLLPAAVHIGYFEWFFHPDTSRHLQADFTLDSQLQTNMRNLPILQELERCDGAVVPTAWQKQQFPAIFQQKLAVIFDGVDESFFHPPDEDLSTPEQLGDALSIANRDTGERVVIGAGKRVLSYATRGMEPLRGFPEFLRAAAALLGQFDDLQVVIAGTDRRAYSYDAPSHNGSWKDHVLASLGAFPERQRLHFCGLLTYSDYRALLWRSTLHCYFTRPYVTSWSLFEAAASGARLAVNRSAATEGIAEPSRVCWVDLDNQSSLLASLEQGLSRLGPRAQIMPGFELKSCLEQWQGMLNGCLHGKSGAC
jgi:glycosyltransferase involved in cell wall biosynthesis